MTHWQRNLRTKMSGLFQVNPSVKMCLNSMCSLPSGLVCTTFRVANCSQIVLSEPGYPSRLYDLAAHINQPKFPLVFMQFLYKHHHPKEPIAPSTIEECPTFNGTIKVHPSAVARFYAPSDLSRSGGLWQEQI